jgi:hypothetical protein
MGTACWRSPTSRTSRFGCTCNRWSASHSRSHRPPSFGTLQSRLTGRTLRSCRPTANSSSIRSPAARPASFRPRSRSRRCCGQKATGSLSSTSVRIPRFPRVSRLHLPTGQLQPWRELRPRDAAGVNAITKVMLSQDARTLIFNYRRVLSELFIVEPASR